jgi:glycosyltransferase involved in cell wall biosynthesis
VRLLVVSGTFHPEPGGPPTYLYQLLPRLQARGHAISVVTYGDVEAEPVYPYPVQRISRRQPIPARLLALTRASVVQAHRADLIFASDYGLPAMLARLLAARPIALKVVSDFAWEYSLRHRLIPPDTSMDAFQTRRCGPSVALVRAIQRAYVRAARLLIVPSRYIEGIVRGWGAPPDKLRVIYNAVEPSDFDALPDRATLRAQMQTGDEPLIVCLARLTAWKGVDGLIRALPVVRGGVAGARLWVAGDGPMRAEWERLAAQMGLGEAVRFLGQMPRQEAAKLLRAADVLALFSTYEGLPHVALEAMAAGTPVVASAAGGTPEVVRDGETGLLIPVGDEVALAAALIRVLSDPTLAARLVANARAGLDRFSMERMVESTERVLLEAAGHGG